ncbi:hypothetical protein FHU29_001754 [Hoyosella altamirensis]|uniref:Uncharacterized protein n=2 Tax=Hoyosella altamirensis TaxID=616997 RepID=A0A839RLF3_9ACTN|nr:DUF5947 family protein [Hoyosella altamirensis]MBB3037320.1 hypothetical protein [Hoyosella altamirensis]
MSGAPSSSGGDSPFEVLRRIRGTRPQTPPGERCDMCAVPIDGEAHSHVVDVQGRQLMCVCRPCYLLFTETTANLRFRAVPDRYLRFASDALTLDHWNALDIPVGLAFFFRNSVLDRMVTFYPGPAGATESELAIDQWSQIIDAIPHLSLMLPDVEALLIRVPEQGQGQPECFLVPIDACYELVGQLRAVWRGFDGGQDARRRIDAFFSQVAARSKPAVASSAGGGR